MASEKCTLCGCLLHRLGGYGQPTVEGRSHATEHHFVAERFFGRSSNRRGEVRERLFETCPWNSEGKSAVYCYECHEELLHNPVFTVADMQVFADLVRIRGLNDEMKSAERMKIAGRVKLFHEVIAAGLSAIAAQSGDTPGCLETARLWNDPSPMETGSPQPVIVWVGDVAWVAYLARDPDFPGWESQSASEHLDSRPGKPFGVLRFDGVIKLVMGPQSDNQFNEPPLYGGGLQLCGFHEIHPSRDGRSRWVVTFQLETLDVRACTAQAFPICFATTAEEAIAFRKAV